MLLNCPNIRMKLELPEFFSEKAWEYRTALAAVIAIFGCSVGGWIIRNLWVQRVIRKKIKEKAAECQAGCHKLQEYLHQHGVGSSMPLELDTRNAILSLSTSELQEKLQSGELKAVDVLRSYQSKALQMNEHLNCLVEPIWEAEEQALACDMASGKKGLLHGIPISVKDNYMVKGYTSTGGMCVYLDDQSSEDAVLIQVLKKQGAIPFVRTNIPQLMMTFECSNPIYGRTNNPHNHKRIPGGSSGGEASLIAGGGSCMGFGSDIGGSIRIPAHMCGICGFKPTYGRLSVKNILEPGNGQTLVISTTGPLSRDVGGLVLAMRALLVPEMFELDPFIPPMPFRSEIYESSRPLRIGYYVTDGYADAVPACRRAVLEAKAALERRGHTLVPFVPPKATYAFAVLYIKATFGDGAETFLELLKNDVIDDTLKLQMLGLKMPRCLQWLTSKLMDLFTGDSVPGEVTRSLMGVKSVKDWWKLAVTIQTYKEEFFQSWKDLKLDTVLAPGFAFPAVEHGQVKFLVGGATYTTLYNVLNYPAGSLPVTKVTPKDQEQMQHYPSNTFYEKSVKKCCVGSEGLPVNVQCVGLPFQEELVLRMMKELEDELNKK